MEKLDVEFRHGNLFINKDKIGSIYSVNHDIISHNLVNLYDINKLDELDAEIKNYLEIIGYDERKNILFTIADKILSNKNFEYLNKYAEYFDLNIHCEIEEINILPKLNLNRIKVRIKNYDNLKKSTLKYIVDNIKMIKEKNSEAIYAIYNKYNIPVEYESIYEISYNYIKKSKVNLEKIMLTKDKGMFNYAIKNGLINAFFADTSNYYHSIIKSRAIAFLKHYYGYKNYEYYRGYGYYSYSDRVNYPVTIREDELKEYRTTLKHLKRAREKWGTTCLDNDSLNKLKLKFAKYIFNNDRRANWIRVKKPFNESEYIFNKEELHDD